MDEDKLLELLDREGLPLSSIQKRGAAFFIDDMIISLLFMVSFYDKIALFGSNPIAVAGFFNALFPYIIVVKILYHTIFVYLYGATLGKMALKVRVVDMEYLDKPDFITALSRASVRILSEIFFYLGFFWVFFNPIRATWHDKIAKTLVVDV